MPQVAIMVGISIGLSALTMGVQYLLTKGKGAYGLDPNKLDNNIVSTETYIPVVYGKARVPLLPVFADTAASNQDWLFVIGAVCHGEIESFERIIFDGTKEIIARNDDGKLEIVDSWVDYVYFNAKRGTDSQKSFETPTKTFKKWTKNHRGRGVACVHMNASYNANKFPGGIPTVLVLLKGMKVHDPRDASYPNDTILYSTNPSLCVLDYLKSSRYGFEFTDEELDLESFKAVANFCNRIVTYTYVESPAAPKVELIDEPCNLTKDVTYNYVFTYAYNSSISSEYDTLQLYESTQSTAKNVTINSSYGVVKLTSISVSGDSNVTMRRIYRKKSTDSVYKLLTVLDDNETTTFTDNIKDDKLTDEQPTPFGGISPPGSACNGSFVNYNVTPGLDKSLNYRYKIAYETSDGKTLPSNASKAIKTSQKRNAIRVKLPISEDEKVTKRVIYRTHGYASTYALQANDYKRVVTIENNTQETYIDLIGDDDRINENPVTTNGAISSQEKMFTCNGMLDTSRNLLDNLEDLLSSCRGKLSYNAGKFSITIRDIAVPELFELTEDNIIGNWSFKTREASELVNIIKAGWINPDKNYQKDYAIWPKDDNHNDYLADDGNFKLYREIDLPFTTAKRTAKRIAQIVRKEQRLGPTCTVTVKEEALKLRVNTLVKVTHSTPGWTGQLCWVDAIEINPNFTANLMLTVYDEDAYNLETIEADSILLSSSTLPDPNAYIDEVSGVTITQELYTEETTPQLRIKVTFIEPTQSSWDYSNVYIKPGALSSYVWYKKIDRLSNGVFYIYPVEGLVTYYIKIVSVTTFGVTREMEDEENTEWSYTVEIPQPPMVTALECLNKGNSEDVYGRDFSFSWDTGSTYGDETSKKSKMQRQTDFFAEGVQYEVSIYFTGFSDSVRLGGGFENRINKRIAPSTGRLQKTNTFTYSLDKNIEDIKAIFEDYSSNAYYKTYYGKPQREVTIGVTTINAYNKKSEKTRYLKVVNKAPEMKDSNGTTIVPEVEEFKNKVVIKWSHPDDYPDISHFIIKLAENSTALLGAKKWKKNTAYAVNDIVFPEKPNGFCYKCTTAGTSYSTCPTFPKPTVDTPSPTHAEGGLVWTYECVFKVRKAMSIVTIDTEEDEVDTATYEVTISGLDSKKISNVSASNDFYTAIWPYDVYGVGTRSDVKGPFSVSATEDDSDSYIIKPKGGSGNITVTMEVKNSSTIKTTWTKDTAKDADGYIFEWRAVANTSATTQPTRSEADDGETVTGSYDVISGREEISLDDDTGTNDNWFTLKKVVQGYKYWGRVRYKNKAGQKGDWSHTELVTWATHSTAIAGITSDDLDYQFKKYTVKRQDGTDNAVFTSTGQKTISWAACTLKFKKTDGSTTSYSIGSGSASVTSANDIKYVIWLSSASTVFSAITTSDLNTVTYKDAVTVAFFQAGSDSTQKAFIVGMSDVKEAVVNGSVIAGNSIIGNHVQSASVTSDKISVTNLSSINSDLGAATAGSLTLVHDGGGYIKLKDSSGKVAIRLRVNSSSNPDLVIMKAGQDADNGSDANDPSKVLFSTNLTINGSDVRPSSPLIIESFNSQINSTTEMPAVSSGGGYDANSSTTQYKYFTSVSGTSKRKISGDLSIVGGYTFPFPYLNIVQVNGNGLVFELIEVVHDPTNGDTTKRIFIRRNCVNNSSSTYSWSSRSDYVAVRLEAETFT